MMVHILHMVSGGGGAYWEISVLQMGQRWMGSVGGVDARECGGEDGMGFVEVAKRWRGLLDTMVLEGGIRVDDVGLCPLRFVDLR
jgi:hypothetical protein